MADEEAVGLGPLLQDDTDDAASEESASNTSKADNSKSRKKNTGKTASDDRDDTPKVMEVDPNLPPGWSRKVSQRKSGASAGHYDVYIISPDKTRFRSRTEIAAYIKANRLKLTAEDFDFSPFGRQFNTRGVKKKTVVRDLVDRVKSRGSRSKPTKEEKKQTPTLASRLKVKMNFSTGRKRKGAEEDKVEEKTPPNKRRKVNQQKEAAPAKRTPKGKTG